MQTALKLMFDHNIKAGPKLKDLCVIKRNGWTVKVPLMNQAFERFVLNQQEAESVISGAVHGIEYRAFFATLFQRDTPF